MFARLLQALALHRGLKHGDLDARTVTLQPAPAPIVLVRAPPYPRRARVLAAAQDSRGRVVGPTLPALVMPIAP